MKKGFFLLEALLACVLLSLLVGAVIHHYAQWSRSYRYAIQQSKAITVLMTLIEQRVETCDNAELFTIATKKNAVDAPKTSWPIDLPTPQCYEIVASWHHDGDVYATASLIVGGSSAQ